MPQKHSNYFEGILQLRNSRDEIVDFIVAHIKNEKNRNIFISRVRETKNGIDLYFSDKKYVQKIARALQNKFGGILHISPQLFSRNRQTSKDIYRVNASLKFLSIKKDDIIKFEKKVIKITRIEKKIHGKNLATEADEAIELDDRYEKLGTAKVLVVKTYPEIEVLHPETYQNAKLENKMPVKKEKVIVAIDGNKLWIVS